jgi:hypothetical protein
LATSIIEMEIQPGFGWLQNLSYFLSCLSAPKPPPSTFPYTTLQNFKGNHEEFRAGASIFEIAVIGLSEVTV